MPNRITEIHSYEFGRDVVRSQRSFDFALVSLFANLEALERYQQHRQHLPGGIRCAQSFYIIRQNTFLRHSLFDIRYFFL